MPKAKPSTDTSTRRKRIKYIVLVIVGLVAVVVTGWWLTRNDSLYAADKTDVERQAKQVLGAAAGPNAPIQDSFDDEGCRVSDIGWLGTHTSCGFAGQRLFKASGDAKADIRATDEQLRAMGYSLKNDSKSSAAEILDEVATVKGGASLTYSSPASASTAYVHFFRNDPERTITARGFLKLSFDLPLTSDEYVYGVSVRAPYWSCSNTGGILASCPSPPSAPVRE